MDFSNPIPLANEDVLNMAIGNLISWTSGSWQLDILRKWNFRTRFSFKLPLAISISFAKRNFCLDIFCGTTLRELPLDLHTYTPTRDLTPVGRGPACTCMRLAEQRQRALSPAHNIKAPLLIRYGVLAQSDPARSPARLSCERAAILASAADSARASHLAAMPPRNQGSAEKKCAKSVPGRRPKKCAKSVPGNSLWKFQQDVLGNCPANFPRAPPGNLQGNSMGTSKPPLGGPLSAFPR